jgi:hypothetical protein
MPIFKAMMPNENVELRAFYFPETKMPYRVQWYDMDDHVHIGETRLWPASKRMSWAVFIVDQLKISHLTTEDILRRVRPNVKDNWNHVD